MDRRTFLSGAALAPALSLSASLPTAKGKEAFKPPIDERPKIIFDFQVGFSCPERHFINGKFQVSRLVTAKADTANIVLAFSRWASVISSFAVSYDAYPFLFELRAEYDGELIANLKRELSPRKLESVLTDDVLGTVITDLMSAFHMHWRYRHRLTSDS